MIRSRVQRHQSVMLQQKSQSVHLIFLVSTIFTRARFLTSHSPTTENTRNHDDSDHLDTPSNVATTNQNIEAWFASIRKSVSFYSQHGDIKNRVRPNTSAVTSTMTPAQQIVASQQLRLQRCYFYNVDLHGRLYLEDNPIKNTTSSIKDAKFLDFFFARIMYINETHKEYMKQHNIPSQDYPFVSICQNEWNFIRPAATPIVFHSIDGDGEQCLLYGSSNTSALREPFDDTHGIVISKLSGKLYHKLTTHSYFPLSLRKCYPLLPAQQLQQYALIRSSVALSLSHRIVDLNEYYNTHSESSNNNGETNETFVMEMDEPQQDKESDDNETHLYRQKQVNENPLSISMSSGLGFVTKYNGVVPIMYLPSYGEPGPYAMPSSE